MFQILSSRFQEVFRRLRGEGKLSEQSISDGLREMRRALLEADVHLRVVQDFLGAVRERARGEKLTESWTPTQKLTAIVREELVRILSAGRGELELPAGKTGVILMVGLQGSGKTATTAKLGYHLRRRGRHPLLVPADTRRPAAREQLRRLAEKAGVDFFLPADEVAAADPVAICRAALQSIRSGPARVVVIDTAGRLHVDDALMQEMQEIHRVVEPDEVLYVADAMTGQDAVRSSQAFRDAVGLTGVILSKLDGDARGGAALSVVSVTGVPIKFFGTGEGSEDLESFSPERMAARILGLGDLQSFLEKVETSLAEGPEDGEVEALEAGELDLEQVRSQLRKLRKAGPLHKLLEMLPGGAGLGDLSGSGDQLRETLAVLDSMTPKERRHPEVMNGSRRRRVARGSGVKVEMVNRFLRQFAQVRKLMQEGMPGGRSAGAWRRAFKGLR